MRWKVMWLALLAATAAPSWALESGEPFTGIVKIVEGAPVVVRGGVSTPAFKGMRVEKGDTIRTDRTGAISLVFSDDTLLSLGPDSAIMLDDYVFDPRGRNLSFVAKILRGTVAYLSGQMGRLSPQSVRLVLPTGTIGIRGTHVLVRVP